MSVSVSDAVCFHAQEGEAAVPSRLANVESLFSELAAIYGARFADMWRSTDANHVKTVWANALSGFKVGEVRQGLEGCRVKPWPPTLPEFLLLCRQEPDYESLFVQAQVQAWKRANAEDNWSEPALFWTAYEYGFYDLKMASWQTAKLRWTRIFSAKRDKALPPVPKARLVLDKPGEHAVCRESARQHIAGIKAMLKAGQKGDGGVKGGEDAHH